MMKKTWSAEKTRNIRHKKEEERNSKAIAHHDQQLPVAVNKFNILFYPGWKNS